MWDSKSQRRWRFSVDVHFILLSISRTIGKQELICIYSILGNPFSKGLIVIKLEIRVMLNTFLETFIR